MYCFPKIFCIFIILGAYLNFVVQNYEYIGGFNEYRNSHCFVVNGKINQTYRQTNEETFLNNHLLNKRMNVRQFCGESICSVHNVEFIEDLLLLKIGQENSGSFNYTGAEIEKLTEPSKFSDRYEFRVAMPIGDGIRVFLSAKVYQTYYESCFVTNANHDTVNQTVRIILNTNEENEYESEKYSEEYHNYTWKFDLDLKQKSIYRFHLMGLQISDESLKFFFDDFYTEPYALANNSSQIIKDVNIKIDVEDKNHAITNLSSTWKCPALLVDYVKQYSFTEEQPNYLCPKLNDKLDEWFIEDVCKRVLLDNHFDENKENQIGCFANGNLDEIWKLTWEDTFEDTLNDSNWKVDEKVMSQNVQVNNEYLGLYIRAGKYDSQFNYTGARITSRQFFPQGRIEIRAAYPKGGHTRVCFGTVNSTDHISPQSGQVYFGCFSTNGIASSDFHGGVYVDDNEATVKHLVQHQKHYVDYEGDYSFYIIGIEWNNNELRYFYDDKYSDTFQLKNAVFQKTHRQIQIEIGVNGSVGVTTQSNNNRTWDCPLLLVDYVRVYEKVSSNYFKANRTTHGHRCRLVKWGDSYVMKAACRDGRKRFFEFDSKNNQARTNTLWVMGWKIILISSLSGFIVGIIICLFFQRVKNVYQLDGS